MQPRQHGFGTIRRADLNGVMLLIAMIVAKHQHPPGGRDMQRHTCAGYLAQLRGGGLRDFIQRQHGQPGGGRIQPQHQCGGQQMRAAQQGERRAAARRIGVVAPALIGPFHRIIQVCRRVGRGVQPAQIGPKRQSNARMITAIDACFQRFGAGG